MNNCDIHDGVIVVWDETVDCGCPLCRMEEIFDDLFCAAHKLDAEIGGAELAQMPKEIAKKLVSFKKIVQELEAEKEERIHALRSPAQDTIVGAAKKEAIVDITMIPISKLESDLRDGRNDIGFCEVALSMGVQNYSGGSVRERLDVNRRIVDRITAELSRRAEDMEAGQQPATPQGQNAQSGTSAIA